MRPLELRFALDRSGHEVDPWSAPQLPETGRDRLLAILVMGAVVLAAMAVNAVAAAPAVSIGSGTHLAPTQRPVARTDANSRRAHEQLLDKARTGRIDVYFVGDSITRRCALFHPICRSAARRSVLRSTRFGGPAR